MLVRRWLAVTGAVALLGGVTAMPTEVWAAGKKPAASAVKKSASSAKKAGSAAKKGKTASKSSQAKPSAKSAKAKGKASKGKKAAAVKKFVPPKMTKAMKNAAALAAAMAAPPTGDDRITMARQAFRDGNSALLVQLENQRDGHPLQMYVLLWRILDALRQGGSSDAEVRQFLAQHPNTAAAEYLRTEWLKLLAKQGSWRIFRDEVGNLRQPLSRELRCLNWQARMAEGDAGRRAVLPEVASAWMEETREHNTCDDVFNTLATWSETPMDARWWRFRRLADSRRPQEAAPILASMPDSSPELAARYTEMLRQPAAYLAQLPPSFAQTRSGRELALAAVARLAREDAPAAQAWLATAEARLPAQEAAAIYGTIAMHAAQSHLPQATAWFEKAGIPLMSSDQRAWRVRAYLRAQDWPGVARAIAMLPEHEQDDPVWLYWRGRALAAQGERKLAQTYWQRLQGDRSFYGLLAANELGQRFTPPPQTRAISDSRALAAAQADPSLERALAFMRLDLRAEGLREWAWAIRDDTRSRDTAFLMAAAQLAADAGFYDRAIYTAERSDDPQAFVWQYPTPYRDPVEPHASAQGLDLAWIYGLMRQESRFMAPARSPVGAQGLMQVMPATGQWVARKIGLTGYTAASLRDPQTNVLIGTSYMRIVHDDTGGLDVLTSAGYNAGPGRARNWRATQDMEGAIYTETIPFDETRDYVRKVMANTTIYAALLTGKPQSLKARLGTIPAAE